MTTTRQARVWISDGSGAPLIDLELLPVSHAGAMGRPMPYKGAIDAEVPIGEATLVADRDDDVFVPEAEWCLTFPDGLGAHLAYSVQVDLSTPVVLQGIIEGKWLNRLIGTLEWKPSSLGNNLLAAGPGILTTLGEVEAGETGEIEITYPLAAGSVRTQRTGLADLRGQNILELVRAVLERCRETGREIDWIDFSAQGRDAAVANEPERFQRAMRTAGLAPPDLASPEAFMKLAAPFIATVGEDGLLVPPGARVRIAVRGRHGAVVGQGGLTWRHRGS